MWTVINDNNNHTNVLYECRMDFLSGDWLFRPKFQIAQLLHAQMTPDGHASPKFNLMRNECINRPIHKRNNQMK